MLRKRLASADPDQEGGAEQQRQRHQVAHRVVGQRGVQQRVHGQRGGVGQEQRVAVGRRAPHLAEGDDARGAGLVVHPAPAGPIAATAPRPRCAPPRPGRCPPSRARRCAPAGAGRPSASARLQRRPGAAAGRAPASRRTPAQSRRVHQPKIRPSTAPADSSAANHSSSRKVRNSTSLKAVPGGQSTKSRRSCQGRGQQQQRQQHGRRVGHQRHPRQQRKRARAAAARTGRSRPASRSSRRRCADRPAGRGRCRGGCSPPAPQRPGCRWPPRPAG